MSVAGILTCELLVGGSPFEADTKEETYAKIMACHAWLPSHLSVHAHNFVQQVCHWQMKHVLVSQHVNQYVSLAFNVSVQRTCELDEEDCSHLVREILIFRKVLVCISITVMFIARDHYN